MKLALEDKHFRAPKCSKTHVPASRVSKFFPGITPPHPLGPFTRGREKEGIEKEAGEGGNGLEGEMKGKRRGQGRREEKGGIGRGGKGRWEG
jgi:hypothetical protein